MPLGGIVGPEPWSALAAPIDESQVGSLSSWILTAGLLVGASGLPGAALPSPGIGTSVESASAEQLDRPQQPVEPAPIPTPAEAEYFVLLRPVGGADAEADLEAEPAYKRRNISIDDTPQSSESQVSRMRVNEEFDEEGNRRFELKNDNPFLHDNVD